METPSLMADLLQLAGITLDATASSREEAVRHLRLATRCPSVLCRRTTADAMWEREQIFPLRAG